MGKDDRFEVEGVVIEKIRGSKFIVELENGHKCTCTLSGKLRQNNIRILVGDTVTIDLSVKDPTMSNGRIIWRSK
jgi:translation initiation factor IF-1